MKSLIVFALIVKLCSGNPISLVPGDNSHYVEGVSRFIWMPDGDNVPHLVDLYDQPNEDLLMKKDGNDNQYWLYTRLNPNTEQIITFGDEESIWNSNYDGKKQLKIIVHGWNNNGNSEVNKQIRSAFLDTLDANVIVVDWRHLASSNYISATRGVPSVGSHLGDFLQWLFATAGGDWNKVHLVGFSLGAHVVGNAGRIVGGLVSRVTALDPAGPLWLGNSHALNISAGQYVEAIHTDGGLLGMSDPVAHADFYPNRGKNPQPGCWFSICSHSRSYQLFASSVRTDHFIGQKCMNLNEAHKNQCHGSEYNMGNGIITKRGINRTFTRLCLVPLSKKMLWRLISISSLVISSAKILTNNDIKTELHFMYPSNENWILETFENEPLDKDYIRNYAINSKNAYWLYTRSNPSDAQILELGKHSNISDSNFNPVAVTVFLVHGWNGHGGNNMNLLLTKAFLYDGDVNLIVVDWSDLANRNYITAKSGVPEVGKHLARFIEWLITLGSSYDRIHLIGFSLGAHIIGNAGRETGSHVKRITALDPGGPLWKNDKKRLVKTDARYVEVIHTNTALYGYEGPCGHADFYPNGGYKMPGCFLNYCSHSRSYEYMAASVKFNNFLANECESLQDAFDGNCQGAVYLMGNSDLTKTRSGIFRVNTDKVT
ncbi:uncharacterized protein [Battus philenor]|uniref:uncharacterized protein n=1 Tax=Battus philenor TaxID=42288 RepID=UPI0035CF50AE